MLSASQVDRMRTVAERALPDVCTIERSATSSDGGGGSSTSWATHLTDVACRLAPVGGGEQGTRGARIADESTHVITLPAGTDVTEADRLRINGQVYDVTLVRTRAAWELSCRIEATEAPDSPPADGGEDLVFI